MVREPILPLAITAIVPVTSWGISKQRTGIPLDQSSIIVRVFEWADVKIGYLKRRKKLYIKESLFPDEYTEHYSAVK
jgi:hypothetical protein